MISRPFLLVSILFFWVSCQETSLTQNSHEVRDAELIVEKSSQVVFASDTSLEVDTATFAAGCFWCVEEHFKQLKGVLKVTSGFSGGSTQNPTYKQVITGNTGHAEACLVVYDPKIISYKELLEVFFFMHDPTQLNRQGSDVGTQYRSAIFYHGKKQKELSKFYIQKLNEEGLYSSPIVTKVSPFTKFYIAEEYHQDYYANNPDQAYCQFVIKPKLEKYKKVFQNKLK